MNIDLPPDAIQFIEGLVASGQYRSLYGLPPLSRHFILSFHLTHEYRQ